MDPICPLSMGFGCIYQSDLHIFYTTMIFMIYCHRANFEVFIALDIKIFRLQSARVLLKLEGIPQFLEIGTHLSGMEELIFLGNPWVASTSNWYFAFNLNDLKIYDWLISNKLFGYRLNLALPSLHGDGNYAYSPFS